MSDETDSTTGGTATASTIVETGSVEQTTLPTVEEYEALQLERDNYKQMALSQKRDNQSLKKTMKDSGVDVDAIQTDAVTRVTQTFEKKLDAMNRKFDEALLAKSNNPTAPVSSGSSQSEETKETPDNSFSTNEKQMFKEKNWGEKQIARYKELRSRHA